MKLPLPVNPFILMDFPISIGTLMGVGGGGVGVGHFIF